MSGKYTYRPFHISDYDSVILPEQTITQQIELELWGKVNFVSLVINTGKLYSMMFLTDLEGNILYRFGYYPPASTDNINYSAISVLDTDGDGLKKIKVVKSDLFWVNPTEEESIIYYQREDGLFYDGWLRGK